MNRQNCAHASPCNCEVDSLKAEVERLKESLQVKHFSSCSDGSCDDTCGVAYANHFECWLKERTHSIRAKLVAAEKERDRYKQLFELPSAAPELQRKLTAAMKLLQEYSHWHDKNIPNRDYPELCRCRLCCEHADMKRAALSKSNE